MTEKETFLFRKAGTEDIDRAWEIILQAKEMMKRENRLQWNESYPTRELICEDVRKGIGHVLERVPDGVRKPEDVIAYGAVVFDGEPVYGQIDGAWLSRQPFVVLHRLAVADEMKGKGVSVEYLKAVEKLALSKGVHSFKVDTREDNLYMRKGFRKFGFSYCGIVDYRENGTRMAYEKLLGDV